MAHPTNDVTCFCPYHTFQKQQELTNQMENLGVRKDTQTCTKNGNGIKRNFSNLEEETLTRCEFNEQMKKRTKSNENMDFDCKPSNITMDVEETIIPNLHTMVTSSTSQTTERSNSECLRCKNGEPGHYNHVQDQQRQQLNQYTSQLHEWMET